MGARLAQHRGDLLAAHAPQVDIADLQNVISALKPIVLRARRIEPCSTGEMREAEVASTCRDLPRLPGRMPIGTRGKRWDSIAFES